MRLQNHLAKRDLVAETLREEILSGKLPPGTPLEQQDVAARLEVSTIPVREAFVALEADGLVQRRPHRGVIVAQQDRADVQKLYEIRAFLELHAFRHALKRVDEDVITALEQALEAATRALRRMDAQAYRRASATFHEVLVRASGSAVYVEITSPLITRTLYFFPLDGRLMIELHRQHQQILKAVKLQNARGAISLMRRHLTLRLPRTAKRASPAHRRLHRDLR